MLLPLELILEINAYCDDQTSIALFRAFRLPNVCCEYTPYKGKSR